MKYEQYPDFVRITFKNYDLISKDKKETFLTDTNDFIARNPILYQFLKLEMSIFKGQFF